MCTMMPMRDLRKYARQTNIRMLVGFSIILVVVGIGLIYVFWGREAALMGLGCIFVGFTLLVTLFIILLGMEWLVSRNRDR